MPIGLMLIASIKFPLVNDITERVEPQEGQGIFVNLLIKQTSNLLFVFDKPK